MEQEPRSKLISLLEIQKCLFDNVNIRPDRCRYCDVFKMLSLAIQSFSNAAYDFLQQFLPFPSHKSLQKQFGAVIKQYAHSLKSLETISHLLSEHNLPPTLSVHYALMHFPLMSLNGKMPVVSVP
jgi:hypothetical protein